MKTPFFVCLLVLANSTLAALPNWSYDPGPDPKTAMGKELIDLTAAIPNMPDVSNQVMGEQKFRPAFGPVPWRMLQGKNKVKILFIGQDATHIAEAAGRPATAGFGGRAQDLAAYFGVNEGAAFINTYAFTIKGQYGAFSTPYVYKRDQRDEIRFGNLVDNGLWLLGHDVDSPIVHWRNDMIDWIIKNNPNSLKLIVTFGGAARDAIGAYVEAKGGKVGAQHEDELTKIQVAMTKLVYAGGNNEFPVVINNEGKDLYTEVMNTKLDYTSADVQESVKKDIRENSASYLPKMVFTKGGPLENGIIHPAQLNGYELGQMTIAGQRTRSLGGLRLNNGKMIKNDLLVVELPHPTYLSNVGADEASVAVAKNLSVLRPYVERGWKVDADPGLVNRFSEGQPYRYSRADIGPEYYDFGTPGTRMVPVSTASRMSGNPHVIVFGTRDRATFNMARIKQLTEATPAEPLSSEELYITRPRSLKLRYTFDPGPGEKFAKLMKENLNTDAVFKLKEGKSWKDHGIDAFYVKNHPDIGDFGHYRGTFKKPKVLIVADPEGYDDLMTAKALTGERGQYLHGLMKDMGVGDQYLVIKTVPFAMDGASGEDWAYILRATEDYRRAVLGEVLKRSPELIIADGKFAQEAVRGLGTKIPVLPLDRNGESILSDLRTLEAKLCQLPAYSNVKVSGARSNIPRSHLSFYARSWEGTSGDSVLGATDKYKGIAFAVVAPAWAWNQDQGRQIQDAKVKKLIQKLQDNGLPLPGEKVPEFLERVEKTQAQVDPDAA